MIDIIERIHNSITGVEHETGEDVDKLLVEAAGEIYRLRTALKVAQATVDRIVNDALFKSSQMALDALGIDEFGK
jgi:hypothetical protein